MLRTYAPKLFIGVITAAALAATACSSAPAHRPGTTGAAGTSATGAAGTSSGAAAGASATGAAGDTGAAGSSAAAGTTGAAGTGAAGTGAAGTDAAGTTGAAGTAAADNTPPIPLPVTVTSNWFPSGYYGDAHTMTLFGSTDPATRPITMTKSTTGPCANRVAGAVGDCMQVIYNPQMPEGGASGFAGVALLTDAGGVANWTMPLTAPRPAQGATAISAQVYGEVGGEVVDFNAGTDADGWKLTQTVTLTKSWQPVTLSLAGKTYDHIISPFGWGSSSATKITFYYDNVVLK